MMSRHCMNRPLWMTSPRSALNPTIKWWNVTLVLASTWPSACSTVEMLCPKTSMQPLQPSRLARRSSLLTGVQQGLRFFIFIFKEWKVTSKRISSARVSIKFWGNVWQYLVCQDGYCTSWCDNSGQTSLLYFLLSWTEVCLNHWIADWSVQVGWWKIKGRLNRLVG